MFSQTLTKTNRIIEELNDHIGLLNLHINQLVEQPERSTETGVEQGELTKSGQQGHDYSHMQQYLPDQAANTTHSPAHTGQAMEFIEAIPKLTKNAISVAEAFGQIPEKVKTGVNIVGHFAEGTTAAGKLISAAEGGASVVEGIVAGSEVLASAVGIAEVASAFGPPGWVVAIGALAMGTLASQLMSHDEEVPQAKIDPMQMIAQRCEEERENDRKKLLAYHTSETGLPISYAEYKQISDELDSPEMVAARNKRIEEYAQSTKYYEFNIDHDSESSQNLRRAAIAKMYQPLDVLELLIPHNMGSAADYLIPYKNEPKIQLATGEQYDAQLRANLGLPPISKSVKNKQQNYPGNSPYQGSQREKTVVINLNKSMIGNFTINTREPKEGLIDFKRKVEEVLLEILNSANVI